MTLATFAMTLAKLSPKLRTPIQLTGFIVAGVLFFIATVSSPPNLLVQISAGLIGVSILVFGLILNQVKNIPAAKRASFVIILYGFFGVFVLFLFFGSVFYLYYSGIGERSATANEISRQLIASKETLQSKLDQSNLLLNHEKQSLIKSDNKPISLYNAIKNRISKLEVDVKNYRNSLNLIDNLLRSLEHPSSVTLTVIEDARRVLGERNTSFFISTAEAGDLNPIAKALEEDVSESAEEHKQKSIQLAWLRKMDGSANGEQAAKEASRIASMYPGSAQALEYAGFCHTDIGDFESASNYYSALVDTIKKNPLQRTRCC